MRKDDHRPEEGECRPARHHLVPEGPFASHRREEVDDRQDAQRKETEGDGAPTKMRLAQATDAKAQEGEQRSNRCLEGPPRGALRSWLRQAARVTRVPAEMLRTIASGH